MKFTWIDSETGEKDENFFGANGQNGWDKGVGSALTYAERYFILKYFHISTDEDDIDNPEIREQELKEIEGRKPALKDSQLQTILTSKNKDHAKLFLDKCRMSDEQRQQLKAV